MIAPRGAVDNHGGFERLLPPIDPTKPHRIEAHGYVVAEVDHPYDSPAVVLEDGTFISSTWTLATLLLGLVGDRLWPAPP